MSRNIVDLIRKAQAGDADAQYDLGNCYLYGDGVEKDGEKASFWYKQYQQNTANTKTTQNTNVSTSYTTYYNEKPTQQNNEIADLIQKAQDGDADAQCKLGVWYEKGQNYYEAVKWFRKAAEQDNGKAQRYLGNCYVLGAGVQQDYEKAEMWHDKAEENYYAFDEDLLLEMEKAFKS